MSKFEFGARMNFSAYTDEDSARDGYDLFERQVENRFESFVEQGARLFTTNATGIYDAYIYNLPLHAKQYYNCNTCKKFIERYGNLVTITNDGNIHSVLWDESSTPSFFARSVKAMKDIVLRSKVNGVFLSDHRQLGQEFAGGWSHFHVNLPSHMINASRVLTAGQVMAQKKEEFAMLNNAVLRYPIDTVEKALAIIKSDTMYRSNVVLGTAERLKSLIEARRFVTTNEQWRNIVWLAVATAPSAGHNHIRSSMIGTLLDDIQDGLPTKTVMERFTEKMNPSNYMRSKSSPSANAIYEAEKMVEKLGIQDSLRRRYATLEEITKMLWKSRKPKNANRYETEKAGVFSHLVPKDKKVEVFNLPTSVMTWEKFQRLVLPNADEIEVLIDDPNRLMALITAKDNTSENIMKWDNTFSWYYHGGVDAEMRRRVKEAGGRYEDNEIRVSLIWEGLTDLDLHCITPYREEIYYSNKESFCGGYLDLDMNGLDKHSETPVENMRWSTGAPEGHYKFYVHNFSQRGVGGTPFRVELEVNGQVFHYDGKPLMNGSKETVFEFDYVKGRTPVINNYNHTPEGLWSAPLNHFVKVNGITNSPNVWGEKTSPETGVHVFFLLDGVKDLSEGKGRGFFNEMLKPELREIRKTLELYTKNTPIEGADEATACGVGYSKDNEWNLTLKVTDGGYSHIVKIDRWD